MSDDQVQVPLSAMDKAIIVAHSPILSLLYHFGEEMTIQPERTDLPKDWHGKQIMSERQRMMTCDRRKLVAYRTSRKIAKTILLCDKFFRWTLWHAGRAPTDGLLHCPREHHLTNIRLRIESKIRHSAFLNMLIPLATINRSKGVMPTNTGITWFLRIEGRTGTGESMVGPAAQYEIGDEQDYAAWGPFKERQQSTLPGALRALGGVPRGVQGGPFWSIAKTEQWGAEWSKFTGEDGYNCFINPIYLSDEAKQRLIRDHGGTETQAYQTQVLGLDGARVFSSFPIIPTALGEYVIIEITGDDVDSGMLEAELTRLPQTPGDKYLLAGDLGRSPSPTELGYFRYHDDAWLQMARIHIAISDSIQTAKAIHTINLALPALAALIIVDAHGQGAGVLDQLHKNPEWTWCNYGSRAQDAQFNNWIAEERRLVHTTCKHLVRASGAGWFCDVCAIPIYHRDQLEPQRMPTKQWAFAFLKDCLSSGQRWLQQEARRMDYPAIIVNAQDEPVIRALEGTTEQETATGHVQWDTPSRHIVDMMLCTTIATQRLGSIGRELEAVSWLEELGWSGSSVPGGTTGAMPWEMGVSVRR